jgi:ketosteroid isomerase-like protein
MRSGMVPNVTASLRQGEGRARRRDAAELAQAVFDAISRQDARSLTRLIHPEADLEMAMAPDRFIHGRAAVLDVLQQAWARVHTLRIDKLHMLSDTAVIIEGRSRYPKGHRGFADSALVWLCVYRDGMLFRQRLFRDVAAARAAWQGERGATDGLGVRNGSQGAARPDGKSLTLEETYAGDGGRG